MDSMELQVLSYLSVAILAAFVTYVFAVRTTRKGRMFDAKLRIYSDVLGHYQEILMGVDNLTSLQDYDATDEDSFLPNMINLVGELTALGDIDTLTAISDQKKLTSLLDEKGTQTFIEDLRSRATILNSHNMAKNLAEVRFKAGQLKLVKPIDEVKKAVENVLMVMGSGTLTVLQKTFDRFPDLPGLHLSEDLQDMVKEPGEWRKEVETAVRTLATAMQKDLDKTL